MLYEWVIFLALLVGLMTGQFLSAVLRDGGPAADASMKAVPSTMLAPGEGHQHTPCCPEA